MSNELETSKRNPLDIMKENGYHDIVWVDEMIGDHNGETFIIRGWHIDEYFLHHLETRVDKSRPVIVHIKSKNDNNILWFAII